ncbi:MAG: amidohydrolase family protein [Ktedonobacteraceae bacterium]|nr:amidohydrolase family protein [Ktedonobacteraceae bacterium]
MSEAIAITNVKVFDGNALTAERTVVIENGVISEAMTAERTVSGQHGALLPGLIDSHVHLLSLADLEHGTRWGVTTMLDMGSPAMTLTDSLRHRQGLADIRGSGNTASAPGGIQTTKMGMPASSAVTGPADADRFVAERVLEGADYIKVIVEDPRKMGTAALDVATIAALVKAAHQAGLKVIAHVTTLVALMNATNAGVDILTHAPVDADVDDDMARSLATRGIVSVPTLTMMRAVASLAHHLPTHGADINYAHAQATTSAFYRAGVTILAGTDANASPASPAPIPHGESLHDELRLLVEVGLTPVEALRSATVVPAAFFGFTDRGIIETGRRADLLLVEGDPTHDIAATRAIRGIWVAGVQVR